MKSTCFAPRLRVAMAALVIFPLYLSGCANNPQSEAIRDAVTAIRSPGSSLRTPAEIAAYPYAQMRVQLEGFLPAIAVLAEYVEGDHLWYAGGDFWLLQSSDGRIKRLQAGTKQTLVSWEGVALQPAPPGTYTLAISLLDGSEVLASFPVECTLTASVAAAIIVNEKTIDTTRSRYDCQSDGATEPFAMTYWHDAAGRIRRTEGRLWQKGVGYTFEALKVPA